MSLKLKFLIFGILISGSIRLDAQEEKIIKAEAKYYCQCHKTLNKKKTKLDKKTKREEKRNLNGNKLQAERLLFGGDTFDFSFGDCLDKKRSKKVTNYIESLDDKSTKKFRRKVRAFIKKSCPKLKPFYYYK